MNAHDLDIFAITAPGLEPLCAAELHELGIGGAVEQGGVGWRGDLRSLYHANVALRTASRVIVRAGAFRARTFAELERRSAAVPWRQFLQPGSGAALRVTSRKSKLYHTGAIAQRLAGVLADTAGVRAGAASMEDDEEQSAGAQLIIVRFLRDECVVSIDSSGARLQQRGYRQALARAPLRETLAAAMLQASGWRDSEPLLDPLCGSGTIAIEAALRARSIAPGLASPDFRPRSFAFQQWPGFAADLFGDIVTRARGAIRDRASAPIIGSDRNAGAIAAATANAQRAGVAGDIELHVRPLSAVTLPAGSGHIITNPPYGVRVGGDESLRPLYRDLGRLVHDAGGWQLTMLSADPRLDAATRLQLTERLRTSNGGIAVRMVTGTVAAAGNGGPGGGGGV
jgi:putative N6-adenine-specific DNA methylase